MTSTDGFRVPPRVLALVLLGLVLVYVPWAFTEYHAFKLLLPLLCGSVTHLVYWGIGHAVLHRLRPCEDSALDRACLGWTIGATLAGTVTTLLALAGLFHVGAVLGALLVLLVSLWAGLRPALPAFSSPPVALSLILIFVVGATVVLCLAPPLFHDTLTYHLALPMQYAAAGGAVMSPLDHFSTFPILGEMLFSPVLLLTGDPVAASVSHALTLVPLGGMSYAFARRFLGGSGLGAALVVLTSPVVLFVAVTMKPDLVFAVLTAAAAYLVLEVQECEGPLEHRRAMAIGLLLGGMVAARFTGLPWAGLVGLALVIAARRQGGAWVRAVTVAGVAAAAVGGPIYLRNLFALGNPVFPFGSSLFGGPPWLAQGLAALDAGARRVDSLGDLVLYGFRGPLFFTFQNDPTMNDLAGLLPLVLLPLMLLWRPWPRAAKWLAALAAASVPIWLLSQALLRLNPLLFMAAFLLAGWALHRLYDLGGLARPLVIVLAVLTVTGNMFWTVKADAGLRRSPWDVILGRTEPRQHLLREYELYGAFHFINTETPPQTRVLLATGDWRSAYLERRADRSGRYAKPRLQELLERHHSVEDMVTALRALPIDVVVYTPSFVAREQRFGWMKLAPAKHALLEETLSAMGPPLYADAKVFVLRVPASP